MDEKTLKEYFALFTDAWKLFKHHSNPDGSSEFWDEFVKDSDKLDEKYNHRQLYRNLARAVAQELDRLDRQKRGDDTC